MDLENTKATSFVCFFIDETDDESSQQQLVLTVQPEESPELVVETPINIKDHVINKHSLITPKFVWKTTPNDFINNFTTDYKNSLLYRGVELARTFPIPGREISVKVKTLFVNTFIKNTFNDRFDVTLFNPERFK